MAKRRYVSTQFWDDSYIENLCSDGKLLFMYLITSPETNVAGSFRITVKKIHYHTDIPREKILSLLESFERDGKIVYRDDWMFVVNTIEHQDVKVGNIIKGINAVLAESPSWVLDTVINRTPSDILELLLPDFQLHFEDSEAFERLPEASKYLNLNLNSNLNSDPKEDFGVSDETQPKDSQKEEKAALKPKDPRSNHPAIAAIRNATGKFPKKAIWDCLISVLGNDPSLTKLNRCYQEWILRGYNPQNFNWVTDWYVAGIPPAIKGSQPHEIAKSDETLLEPVAAPRPIAPDRCTDPMTLAIWNPILKSIESQMPGDLYRCWFPHVRFDGFDGERAVKLRAGKVTKDWVSNYYTDLITKTLAKFGCSNMVIDWEVEEESAA